MAMSKQAGQVAAQKGASLVQFQQGGLIDDIDVEIVDAAFTEWDYNGAVDHPVLALGIQYKDGNDKTYDQYYSAGELTYFVPSEDGSMAIPVGDRQLLNDNTNAAKFLASLIEANFPVELLESGNVKAMIGTRCHVNQVAQPKRQGLIRGGKNADREARVLLVSAILSLPGETAPKNKTMTANKGGIAKPAMAQTGKPGLGGGAKPQAAQPVNGQASDADELKLIAAQVVSEVLAANGPLAKKDLNTQVFRAATAKVQAGELDAKMKTKLTQMCFQDSFLHELVSEGQITYDGATIGPA
jgi:hypothetical protein